MINIGSKQLKGISIGTRTVKEVYKGSQKIWSSASWHTIFEGTIYNKTQQISFNVGAQYKITFTVDGTTDISSPFTFTHNGAQTISHTATKSVYYGGKNYTASGVFIIHLFDYSGGNIRCTRGSTSYIFEDPNTGETRTIYIYGGFIVTKVEEYS